MLFPTQAAADIVGSRFDVPPERIRVVSYGISIDAFRDAETEPSDTRYLFLAASPERR